LTVELKNFFIDTVYPVEGDTEDNSTMVQVVRYSVLGSSAEDALRRFIEEEAGVEVERTEPTGFIVIGMNEGGNPFG
jgi:hypothetical protein